MNIRSKRSTHSILILREGEPILGRTSYIIGRLDEIGGLFPDDDAGSHRVPRDNHWHDGCVGDPQIPQTVDPARLMENSVNTIRDGFELLGLGFNLYNAMIPEG